LSKIPYNINEKTNKGGMINEQLLWKWTWPCNHLSIIYFTCFNCRSIHL